MGNKTAKFRDALQNSNNKLCYDIIADRKFREKLDPNLSYGKQYNDNTAMHFASLNAMPKMLALLLELGGDPNCVNQKKETSLHLLCSTSANKNSRLQCLQLILPLINSINATDNKGNTPLHRAAGCGFGKFVELLLLQNVVSTLTNNDGRTAAEEASHFNHNDIGHRIEARILFDTTDDDMLAKLHGLQGQNISTLVNRLLHTTTSHQNDISSHVGLNILELRAEKDQILVYVSEMLQLPLVLTETLLRNYSWNHLELLDNFQTSRSEVFESAGIDDGVIATATRAVNSTNSSNSTNSTNSTDSTDSTDSASGNDGDDATPECMICMSTGVCEPVSALFHGKTISKQSMKTEFDEHSNYLSIVASAGCNHLFCNHCWKSYLSMHIEEADTEGIKCPAHASGCKSLIPTEYIDALVTIELAQKHQRFELDAFVKSNPDFRFCPHPGCGRVVKILEDCNRIRREHMMVDCGEGHLWCWSCLKNPHEPCSCDMWDVWFSHVKLLTGRDIKNIVNRETGNGTTGKNTSSNHVADELWLAANTKPCPKCKTPINKGDGCHHMTCRVCTHEWCWLCGDEWSKHSKKTGGFYSCNRFRGNDVAPQDPLKSDISDQEAPSFVRRSSRDERRVRNNKNVRAGVKNTENMAAIRQRGLAMDKFLHYYSRFEAHLNSLRLERKYLHSTKLRIGHLERASRFEETKDATSCDNNVGFEWLHQAILELVKNRLVLSASYSFACFEYGGATKEVVEIVEKNKKREGSFKSIKAVQGESVESKKTTTSRIGFLTDKAQTTMLALEAIMGKSSRKHQTVTQEQQLFEMQQADLEIVTEQLSEMVARKHVRVTRQRVLQTALQARLDRENFTAAVATGLIPDQQNPKSRRRAHSNISKKLRNSKNRRHRRGSGNIGSSASSDGGGSSSVSRNISRNNSLPPSAPSSRREQFPPPSVGHSNSQQNSRNIDLTIPWQCTTCTLINSNTDFCNACDTPRGSGGFDGGESFAQSIQAQLFDSVRQHDSNEPDWSCAYCTVFNSASRVRCSVCGAQRNAEEHTTNPFAGGNQNENGEVKMEVEEVLPDPFAGGNQNENGEVKMEVEEVSPEAEGTSGDNEGELLESSGVSNIVHGSVVIQVKEEEEPKTTNSIERASKDDMLEGTPH
jgi:ankyrin repeat/IBR domain-containing protein 1